MSTKNYFGRLLREPLLHFLLLGIVLFTVDHVVAARQDDPRTIVVGADVDDDARQIFRNAQGREPTAAELKVLRERWVDTEVLYREGLAMRLDQGDPTIRERVVFKALSAMQANLALPPIDDAGLRAWFEKNRGEYDEPERLDFLEAVVIGDSNPAAVEAFAKALNSGTQNETRSGLRAFKGRPRNTIVASFGEEFAAALEKSKPGEWHALPSKDGLRVVRFEGKAGGKSVAFEEVKSRVMQDWQDQKMQALRTAAVRELAKKYTIRVAAEARR